MHWLVTAKCHLRLHKQLMWTQCLGWIMKWNRNNSSVWLSCCYSIGWTLLVTFHHCSRRREREREREKVGSGRKEWKTEIRGIREIKHRAQTAGEEAGKGGGGRWEAGRAEGFASRGSVHTSRLSEVRAPPQANTNREEEWTSRGSVCTDETQEAQNSPNRSHTAEEEEEEGEEEERCCQNNFLFLYIYWFRCFFFLSTSMSGVRRRSRPFVK